ncbi:lysophospholipid acyltransferase family protein [Bathymodiolus septemdierum thioautotrophic gill symbiont]|uniref:Lipid A biosynthesis lauroyl acyltransferase n=1 Tax=endosymbiont of Bathymodiolus septemdierum str. Myojin knoll TaxID=1303921 RepID=A0A0P0USF1_9GAMM|nr:lysophospholipid acyltransferase family protein [Bathymodiolus septemdierum thioautotrophic gill symbiont]BAS68220.1 hypothetical protein BSEPE_1234 [endosymbiont of Bathymodiolus septemdierum str. Myojin knoll]
MAQRILLALLWGLLKAPKFIRAVFIKGLIWLLLRAKLGRICKDMRVIFNQLSEQEICALARLCIVNVVSNVINILDIKNINYTINAPMPIEQLTDNGAVFASIHMGKADSAAYALKQSGIKVCTIIGAGKKSPALHQLGLRILQYLDIPYIKKSKSIFFQLVKALSQGQSIFVHGDLKNTGLPTSFLGFQTTIPKTAPSLSILSNRPLYFVYSLPGKNANEYIINIELVEGLFAPKLTNGQKIEQLTYALTRKMEAVILQNPEQWFWVYNRFKNCQVKKT